MDKEKELCKKMADLFMEVSRWSKLNRIAGFPADLYDQMMSIMKEVRELENTNTQK